MNRKLCTFGLAVLMAAGLAAARQKDAAKISPVTGTALLDRFIDNYSEMARGGSGEKVEAGIQEMGMAARTALEARKITPVFYGRYNRLLALSKLVTLPDKAGILGPVVDRMLTEFVQDKLGPIGTGENGGKGSVSIALVAQAITEEIIDLQIYLDTLATREALMRKLDGRTVNK
jgi:hypothetical protein